MSLLQRNEKDDVAQEILDEIKSLSKRLAKLEGREEQAKEGLKLSDEIVGLKKQLVDLEIERDKKQEGFDRSERETRHEVGLLRKQVEVEQEQAKREAVLEVREENLTADRERFEEQMKFTTQHMQREIERIERIATELMARLPTVEVNKSVGLPVAAGNGNGDES